jgi:F420-non-reducing hydrogenase small subunit
VALDFKKRDVEALADGSLAAAFINGAVRLEEQAEWARLLRRKAQAVVAFGACAHLGGIPGLANFSGREETLRLLYAELPGLHAPGGVRPARNSSHDGADLELPEFHDRVRRLDEVVEVDYYLPGCPPPTALFLDAAKALLAGALPPRGSVLAPSKALCDTCPRKDSKPEVLDIRAIRRVATSTPDLEKCLLAEGYLCLGPATRSGCGETCIRANMPCRGCFGPVDGVDDLGAAFLSALGTLLADRSEEEVAALVGDIPDLAGTLYRYGLPASLLGGARRREAP